jgi:hypothetical protein
MCVYVMYIDNHLNWKNRIDQMIPNLGGEYYAVRSMFHVVNIDTLKSIYFAYLHSTMRNGDNFLG